MVAASHLHRGTWPPSSPPRCSQAGLTQSPAVHPGDARPGALRGSPAAAAYYAEDSVEVHLVTAKAWRAARPGGAPNTGLEFNRHLDSIPVSPCLHVFVLRRAFSCSSTRLPSRRPQVPSRRGSAADSHTLSRSGPVGAAQPAPERTGRLRGGSPWARLVRILLPPPRHAQPGPRCCYAWPPSIYNTPRAMAGLGLSRSRSTRRASTIWRRWPVRSPPPRAW